MSIAVAPGSVKLVWHSTVIGFAPLSVMTGLVVSVTLTVRVTGVAALPDGSLGVVGDRVGARRVGVHGCRRRVAAKEPAHVVSRWRPDP